MHIVLVNPVGATPDLTFRAILSPKTPSIVGSAQTLRETNIVELGNALTKLGNRVTVLIGSSFLARRTWELSDQLEVTPIRTVLSVPFHPAVLPLTPTLGRHPVFQEADIVQVGEFYQPSTYFACRATRRRMIPVVLWQETFASMRAPGSAYQFAYDRTLGKRVRAEVDRYIPRTTNAIRYLLSLGVDDRSIAPWIPTGVDLDTFVPRKSQSTPHDFGWPDDVRILLVVGRLQRAKGMDFAMHVVRHILDDRGDVRLIIRGSGPEEESLQRLAVRLRIADKVRILGRRSRQELVDLYNLADVALCTSYADLLPFSLIEASSCGRACVTTDVGAIRDIVVDGETGRVVGAGDVEMFSQAIFGLLRDEDIRARMGKAARERMERIFGLPHVARALMEEYRSVTRTG